MNNHLGHENYMNNCTTQLIGSRILYLIPKAIPPPNTTYFQDQRPSKTYQSEYPKGESSHLGYPQARAVRKRWKKVDLH
jgi:hypothetical protein